MEFGSKETSKIVLSERFEFEWSISFPHIAKHSIVKKELASSVNGGVRFHILAEVSQGSSDTFRIGLRKSDENVCEIKVSLTYEVGNDENEIYVKDSINKRFSRMGDEYYSEYFFCKHQLEEGVQDFSGRSMIIKGKIFFQCCEALDRSMDQLQSDLKDLLQNKIYADVKFQIGDAAIEAHKNILCSRSQVFRKMFEQNMKEKEVNSVEITDIEKPVFDAFLNFLYTGAIQDNKVNTIMSLYSVADKYAVESLHETCRCILVDHMSDKTVVSILTLADMHSDVNLKATAVTFISENFAKVEITDSWNTLLSSDPRLASFVLKQVSIAAAKNVSIKRKRKNQEIIDNRGMACVYFNRPSVIPAVQLI